MSKAASDGTRKQPAEPEISPSHNLPSQPTVLVGREQEVDAACDLLRRPEVRLLTLTGPGGVGKTRLALQVAERLLDNFADGVYFVSLSPITDPDLVISAIARALGLMEAGERLISPLVKEYLRGRQVLLLLDNFEQVTQAAPLLAEILADCPRVKALATSREKLRLRGEKEMVVPPLALPYKDSLPRPSVLSRYAAVELFVHRALDARPDFTLTSESATAVAEICRRLDGLPLAIELAAARTKLFSPQEMLARFDGMRGPGGSPLQILTGGAQDLPARHQTLRKAIEWSYDLLTPNEQQLFRRLSVFAGSCTLEAAEYIAGDAPPDVPHTEETQIRNSQSEIRNSIELVSSLIDKSLLRQVGEAGGEPRVSMLETIREYAWERLRESGEVEVARRQHAAYYLALAESVEPALAGPDQIVWLERLEAEHGNLNAALAWSQGPGGEVEWGLRLAGALVWLWRIRGHLTEGRDCLAGLLGRSEAGRPTEVRAKALHAAGWLAGDQGDYAAARRYCEESLAIRRKLGDKKGIARSLIWLGNVAGDQGDYASARALLEEGRATAQEVGDRHGLGVALNGLGELERLNGDYEAARTLYESSLDIFRKIGGKMGIAYLLHNLAHIDQRQDDFSSATAHLHESLEIFQELGHKQGIAMCVAGLSGVAASQGHPERAARLMGAAEALLETIGARLDPADFVEYTRKVSDVRDLLGTAAFSAAWSAGRAMPVEQAIASSSNGHAGSHATYPAGLTEREAEVLRLVALGLTNVQVAEKLAISPRTVNVHLTSVYGKLGVTSRTAAARFMHDDV